LRYGIGINTLLDLNREEGKLWAWIVMASVPAGIYAGDKLFSTWQPSNGQAWSLTLWGEMGAYTMRQLHHILEKEPEDPDVNWLEENESEEHQLWEEDHRKWKKTDVLFELAGYPLGTYLGHRVFGKRHYTFGDALMLFQGRGLGWLYSLMLGDIANVEFHGTASRLLRTAGTVSGTLLFDRLIDGSDYTFGQATLTALGTVSGMAFAGGISVILEIDDVKVTEIFLMTGGAAGLYLAKSILDLRPEDRARAGDDGPTVSVFPWFHLTRRAGGVAKTSLVPVVNVTVMF
ncbi:MAG: hypothetical protein ACE5GH_07620, partial [Fidelibacterota bacterium]